MQEKATLAGGCFWCLDAAYRELKGVSKSEAGYAGGSTKNPTYEQVCDGDTGHAEVVQITFDPKVISYRDLLEVFFSIHDPTTMNRQGGDIGTQYRSGIFTHDAAQEKEARAIIAEMTSEKVFASPIVTKVEKLGAYYPAEDYHQDYFNQNPGQGYCAAVVAPKLAKFRKKWGALRKTP